ncbi:MAG: hypothetical protein KHY00_08225 [Firmicutes bacterium]|nr:hypothetical protein [Bacillota bacterium]
MCKRYCIFDKKCYNKLTLFNRNAEHFGGLRTAFCGGRAADKVTAEKTDWEETYEKTTFEFRTRGADDLVAPAGHGAGGKHCGQWYLRCGGDLDAGQ